MGIDDDFAALNALVPQIQKALSDTGNEAAHRMHGVDEILKQVLGWGAQDIVPEEYSAEGRIDYLLQSTGFSRAIVEAKSRDTLWFPTTHLSGSAYKLGGTVFSHDNAKAVIQQAAAYARAKHVSLTVATNAFDWIVFQGNRIDGVDILDGKAFLFQGLEGLIDHFPLFHALLHKESVLGRVYTGHFEDAERGVSRTFTFSSPLFASNKARTKSSEPHAADLAVVFNKFFREITSDDDPDLLAKCFVETKASQEADRRLERLAQNLTTTLQPIARDPQPLIDTVQATLSREDCELVLIVGPKGAGKSTFIHRFFRSVLSADVREKCSVLRIDLSLYVENHEGVAAWITGALVQALDDTLDGLAANTFQDIHAIFNKEYERLRRGPWAAYYTSDKTEFDKKFGQHIEDMRTSKAFEYAVEAVGSFARNRNKLPVLVFDNADHHGAAVQEEVFKYGVALAKQPSIRSSLVIVPVTERTLVYATREGAFASHYSTRYYLPAPPAREVVRRRLSYAIEEFKKVKSPEYVLGTGIKLQFNDLVSVLSGLYYALSDARVVASMVAMLANDSIRDAFDIFRRIILSPYLTLQEIFNVYATKDPSQMRFSAIMKGLLKGDKDLFVPQANPFVVNIFDLTLNNSASPLLGLRLLSFLATYFLRAKQSQRLAEADVPASDITEVFLNVRVHVDDLTLVVDELLRCGLIEAQEPGVERFRTATTLSITPRGMQHYIWCMRNVFYIEAMAQVTPLHDEVWRGRLDESRSVARGGAGLAGEFAAYSADLDSKLVQVPGGERYEDLSSLPVRFETRWKRVPGDNSSEENAT